jgi:hypothetical protein
MTSNDFFIPTKQFVLNVKVGSQAPNCFGEMAEVTEVTARKQDTNGKWFVCFSTKFGNAGSISESLKEDELHITTKLSAMFDSWQLNDIERELLANR